MSKWTIIGLLGPINFVLAGFGGRDVKRSFHVLLLNLQERETRRIIVENQLWFGGMQLAGEMR